MLRADVGDASMLLKSFPCDAMHKSSAFQHGAYQVGQVYVASHLYHLAEEASVVDCVEVNRQVLEDSTGDQALLIAIFSCAPSLSVAGSYTIFPDEIRLFLE